MFVKVVACYDAFDLFGGSIGMYCLRSILGHQVTASFSLKNKTLIDHSVFNTVLPGWGVQTPVAAPGWCEGGNAP